MFRTACLTIVVVALTAAGCATSLPPRPPRAPGSAKFSIRKAVYDNDMPGYKKIRNPIATSKEWLVIWVSPKTEIDENDVYDAEVVRFQTPTPKGTITEPAVAVTMTPEGSKKLEALTREHDYSRLALFVNDRLVMSPYVSSVITDGKLLIHGDLTEAQAATLAADISGRRPGANTNTNFNVP